MALPAAYYARTLLNLKGSEHLQHEHSQNLRSTSEVDYGPILAQRPSQYGHSVTPSFDLVNIRILTMTPYNPKTSAKIRMRTMPTYNLGC